MAHSNLIVAVAIWVVLAIATLSLALYRKCISASEEDWIHSGPGEEREIPKQAALAARLKTVDTCGEALTVITVAISLVISIMYLYQQVMNP